MSRDITSLSPVPPDEHIRYGRQPSQFFDVFRSRASVGAPAARRLRTEMNWAVMIHGGYWRARYDLQHASHLCAALARNGITCVNLEYRRVGERGGGWTGTFDDVKAGFDAARRGFREQPVVLGHSAGGHLALLLATVSTAMKGVVALAPVADLQMAYGLHLSNDAVVELLGGTPQQVPRRYEAADPSRHSSSVRRLLLHGTKDDTVPIELSESFVKARSSDPGKVELIKIPGANHFDLIDPESKAWNKVLESVNRFIA